MALIKKIKASTTMEAIVSVAIISALMVIIFPFFGQVLNSNHRMEIVRGLHLQNEIKQQEDYNPFQTGTNEFSGDGITIRQSTIQDSDFPQLYHITTEFINSNKKIVYSITEMKYHP